MGYVPGVKLGGGGVGWAEYQKSSVSFIQGNVFAGFLPLFVRSDLRGLFSEWLMIIELGKESMRIGESLEPNIIFSAQ